MVTRNMKIDIFITRENLQGWLVSTKKNIWLLAAVVIQVGWLMHRRKKIGSKE